MYETINEKIDVAAVFGRGFRDARPTKFRWQNREYVITKIGYKHMVRDGRKILHVFSVTDGVNFFELYLDASELKWLLNRVWDGQTS